MHEKVFSSHRFLSLHLYRNPSIDSFPTRIRRRFRLAHALFLMAAVRMSKTGRVISSAARNLFRHSIFVVLYSFSSTFSFTSSGSWILDSDSWILAPDFWLLVRVISTCVTRQCHRAEKFHLLCKEISRLVRFRGLARDDSAVCNRDDSFFQYHGCHEPFHDSRCNRIFSFTSLSPPPLACGSRTPVHTSIESS